MAKKRQKKSTVKEIDDEMLQRRSLVDDGYDGLPDEEPPKKIKRNRRVPTSMWRLVANSVRGNKLRVDYDDIGRPVYAHNTVLQSYIGYLGRSMVPINIKNWHCVPEDIKEKIWSELTNVFEVPPQSRYTILSSAAQKWRDWKTKLTKKYVWPHRTLPKLLIAPPPNYQISPSIWKEFVDMRLQPEWEITHEKQRNGTNELKYRHKTSRKGYLSLEADMRKNKEIADAEEIDRSILWHKAREDSDGVITDEETAEMAAKINELLDRKSKGTFEPSGMKDMLTTALGTSEHYGRVRGVGGFVKPQVYFNLPRKKRESVLKTLTETLKEQIEETNNLKAELANVKAQLALSKSSNGTVSSKKSSNMKDPVMENDVDAVEFDDMIMEGKNTMVLVEFDARNMEGRKCKLAVGKPENVVALGTIVSNEGVDVKIHCVSLGQGNFKVSVEVVLDEEVEFPIPIKSGPSTVGEALGAIVAWPKELVIFTNTEEKLKSLSRSSAYKSAHDDPQAKLKTTSRRPANNDSLDDHRANLKPLSRGAPTNDEHVRRVKKREVDEMLPMSCKFLYTHADRLMDDVMSLRIEFDEEMFGMQKSIWLSKDDIFDFMEMDEIGAVQILIYQGHLFNYLKGESSQLSYSFVNPGCIPIGGDPMKHAQHIIDRLNASSRDSIVLIPYNVGAVKTYNASHGNRTTPSFKQLNGNLKQNSGSVECGFCVLRYMKEIVEREYPELEKLFGGSTKNCYKQAQYDEVRTGWCEFVYPHLG